MDNKKLNIAILAPNQNRYSETFIQAHKNNLKGNVFYYYGIGEDIALENYPPLATRAKVLFLKIIKASSKVLSIPSHIVTISYR